MRHAWLIFIAMGNYWSHFGRCSRIVIDEFLAKAETQEDIKYSNKFVFHDIIPGVKRDRFTMQELNSFCIRYKGMLDSIF